MLNLLRGLAVLVFLAAVLFASAGRWDLPFVWAYLGLMAALTVVVVFAVDPTLQQERWHPAPGGKDLLPWLLVGLPLYLVHFVVAGLDVGRFHWSNPVPGIQIAGLALSAVAWTVVEWAMIVNRFFSGVIRLQSERGHHLVTAGPYRYVRHPGYLAGIVGLLSGPLALGSWWAFVPVLPLILLIVRRTVLEDRFLHEELQGYAEYAHRVRYRLLPGLW